MPEVTYWRRQGGKHRQLTPDEVAAWRARNGRNKGIGRDGRCYILSDAEETARDAEIAEARAETALQRSPAFIASLDEAEANRHIAGKTVLKAFAMVMREELAAISAAVPGYTAPTLAALRARVAERYKALS